MTISSTTKLVVGSLASCSIVGGGTLIGFKYLGKETEKKLMSSLLREKNPEKRLLTSSTPTSEQTGKDAGGNYRNQNKKSNPWGILTGVQTESDVQSDVSAPADFVSKCNSQSNLEVFGSDDSLYRDVLSYCTRDTLVEDGVKESGKSLRAKGDGNSEEGKNLGMKYREANRDKEAGEDEWKLSKSKGTTVTKEQAPEDFRMKCISESKLKAESSGKDSVVRVLAYCV